MVLVSQAAKVSVEQAREIIFDCTQYIGYEQAGIINAHGRTLAQCIESELDVPCCDIAAKDGYAVSSRDTSEASEKSPSSLSVLAEAASSQQKQLEPGTVIRVRAGEPLPKGADAVIEQSSLYRPSGGPVVLVFSELKQGMNVLAAGTSISKGEIMLGQGVVINGAELGILASLGKHGIRVSRKPRVAIITTGAAVADIVENVAIGGVRNSVRYALVGMVMEAGCDLGRLVHVRGGRIELEKAIAGCGICDAVIVSLSPEDKHDIAVAALANIGNIYFERVHIEPGSASAYGIVDGKPVYITSNNTILEVFEALIRPGLLSMLGRSAINRPKVTAALSSRLNLNPGYCHYINAITTFDKNTYLTNPLNAHGSDTRPWMQPDSLILIPQNIDSVKRGESVEVILLSS